ncbi:MAG: phosphoribosylaminoimidazolesuccinocarboxamide synthase [Candidatus Omnitrophica bacterium]|nr:phosphoribosylaminoimidazolesuccinocarboxamide synthase [Candidatus Omnitrophota bacterium]
MGVVKKEKIYEGKAKILYATENPEYLIQYFKDDATAFDATKRGTIQGKGICNNRISAQLFQLLEEKGISTHFIKSLSEREMLVKKVEIIPVEVTIRNIVAGGMSKLLDLEEGIILDAPVLEYHYKNDKLHDPLVNEYHILALKIASLEELDAIKKISFMINQILKDFFAKKNLELVDFKLEFGRYKNKLVLADEISPDTCRLWDKETKQKLDKDRFRRDLGNVEAAYQEVLKRVLS